MDKGPDANAKSELRSVRDACVRTQMELQELCRVNKELDDAYRFKFESASTVRLRLGKAHSHIQAASRWEIEPDVLHVLSPEIRAATKILQPVVAKYLAGGKESNELNRIHSQLRSHHARLEQFVHPNPCVLALPRDVGGFDEPVWQLYLAKVYLSLYGILVEYATALASFATEVDAEKVSEILVLLSEASSELSTLENMLTRSDLVEGVQAQ